jgi:hypothetical protein
VRIKKIASNGTMTAIGGKDLSVGMTVIVDLAASPAGKSR